MMYDDDGNGDLVTRMRNNVSISVAYFGDNKDKIALVRRLFVRRSKKKQFSGTTIKK